MSVQWDGQSFRYGSRKEYEVVLYCLMQEGDDDGYEQLVEEYVRFLEQDVE